MEPVSTPKTRYGDRDVFYWFKRWKTSSCNHLQVFVALQGSPTLEGRANYEQAVTQDR